MSEITELQDEEREALISIYEGDSGFKQLNSTTFQYKYGEDNDNKSFLVELIWGENYPNDRPIVNLEVFYNRHIISAVKEKISSTLTEEAQEWLGCGMTYTLFECLKERLDELLQNQPEAGAAGVLDAETDGIAENLEDISLQQGASKKILKKEQLSKAQKRKQWERQDHKGERERGWDWVDVIKHLSQTGYKHSPESSNTSTTTAGNVTLPNMTKLS